MSNNALATTASLGFAAYVGVSLCLGIGIGGYWLQIPSPTFATMFGDMFWYLAPNVALTLLPGFTAAAVLFARSKANADERRRWGRVLALLMVSLAITAFYHVPANLRIWSGEMTPTELTSELQLWLALHAVRTLPAIAAAFVASRSTPSALPAAT